MWGSEKPVRLTRAILIGSAAILAQAPAAIVSAAPAPAAAAFEAGKIEVPVNKSQVVQAGRNFKRALVGNPEIADVLPLSNDSLYVLGKKAGTTTLTLYDAAGALIRVYDVAVGPDVITLRRQFTELMPNEKIGARISNDAIVLTGVVSSGPIADRAMQVAATYAPEKVVNLMSIGGSQQVMLEVRFSEMSRTVAKQIGVNNSFISNNRRFQGGTGNTAPSTTLLTNKNGTPTIDIGGILDTFGIAAGAYSLGGLNLFSALDLLERKGVVKTLAEPTLIALSGETASFLAGGEFPIPVIQGNSGGGGTAGGTGGGNGITIEFKPFGVSLAFTPTVLGDGIINLVVAPEVSQIDPSASVNINGLVVPGLQTRRARTVLELRDGQSFAIAGLLSNNFQDTVRQIPALGSIPILGSLFRSTGFQKQETELVIIVTPRLVKPMNAADVRLPTDRVGNPNELELFLMGRTDKAVGTNPLDPNAPPPEKPALAPADKAKSGGFSGPTGYEM
ncbi:pilus assembly protein CpaC [Sphingomonas sp. YR710]|uniref:type II and III secretion system protein family protein n=1 Tax=Sphingomonas sp. YR710 TaxID=1882773 RepID=UPI000880C156|nr:type II and III secretion system protein family protein [Sphingomonas sp. YR710]SDD48875.1 pilus assembly protein CpaC [Sphingomonas sp. YR710]